MNIDMVPVTSSNVANVGYHPETQTLAVEYANGGIYHYQGVPPETHAGLMSADSVGKFLGSQIRGVFSFEKQDPQTEQQS